MKYVCFIKSHKVLNLQDNCWKVSKPSLTKVTEIDSSKFLYDNDLLKLWLHNFLVGWQNYLFLSFLKRGGRMRFIYTLAQSVNWSARIMSIFQETWNGKKSENSDNKTGDYSSFKITEIYFQKKSLCNFFGKKMESTLPKYAPSISQLLIIPCIGYSKPHFLPLVLNGKKMLIC